MAKNKFYAVKKGKTTGIFSSWDECKPSIDGFPGAVYKSFATEDEARAFLDGENIYWKQIANDLADGYAVAYTDGSYDEKLNHFAYGVCIFDKDGSQVELYSLVKNQTFASSRNIAGEIYGVLTALDWAVSNGYEKIRIYHDLEGIAKWANGEYNADSEIAKYYIKLLNEKFAACIKYEFIKVKGHSNNPYNEKADQLASLALKGERRMIKGANSFVVSNFDKKDLDTILSLVKEEHEDAGFERKEILGGEQIKLIIGKRHTMIKAYNNKNLLVQGAPNVAYQVIFTYVSELLGEKEIIPLIRQAYRIKVNTNTVDDNFQNYCPNIPDTYNSNIKTLIKQAIINLNGYFEAEEYGQYAFPVLRAMEGHIKYLFDKSGVAIGREFKQFEKDSTGKHILKNTVPVPSPHNANIEDCYNFYVKNRHRIFHFGDIIGEYDNTYLITTKEDADEIIKEALRLINRTVY